MDKHTTRRLYKAINIRYKMVFLFIAVAHTVIHMIFLFLYLPIHSSVSHIL